MANEDILAEIERMVAPEPSAGERVGALVRSAAQGPTFGFADEGEALATAALDYFAGKTGLREDVGFPYYQRLGEVRAEQERGKIPYLNTATEIATSFINPLDKVAKLAGGAKGGLTTLNRLFTNPASQAALTGVGYAEGNENIGKEAALSGALGSVFWGGGNVLGNLFGKAGKEADKLKLSAYGIGKADLQKQLKKVIGDKGKKSILGQAGEAPPFVNAIDDLEKAKLINPEQDVLENLVGVNTKLNEVGQEIGSIVDKADQHLVPKADFQLDYTMKFIKKAGPESAEASKAAGELFDYLAENIGAGTVSDLQKLKTGLNYIYDENPYKRHLVKEMRRDLQKEIEKRVDSVAAKGLLGKNIEAGSLKKINQKYGTFADTFDAFVNKAGADYGVDIIQDTLQRMRTSGGTGTLNVLAGAGSAPAGILAAGLNLLNTRTGKSKLADTLREFKVPLEAAGKVLPKLGISRAPTVTYQTQIERDKSKKPIKDLSMDDIFSEIQRLANTPIESNAKPAEEPRASLDFNKLSGSGAQKKTEAVELSPVSAIEAEIDADPFYSAVYEVESGRNPKAKNPNTTASGGFQFVKKTANSLGLKDPFDLKQSFEAMKKLTEEGKKALKTDDPRTLYAAHLLGWPLVKKLRDGEALNEQEKKNLKQLGPAMAKFDEVYKRIVA